MEKTSFEIELKVTTQYGLIYMRGEEGNIAGRSVEMVGGRGEQVLYYGIKVDISLYSPKVSKHFHLDSLSVFA